MRPMHNATIADPLRHKWLRLPLPVQQQLSAAFDQAFGIQSLPGVRIIPLVSASKPPTPEQHGWLVQEIVAAWQQHIESQLPPREADRRTSPETQNPGSWPGLCAK